VKLSARTQLIGLSTLVTVFLLGLTVALVVSVPSQDASARNKHPRNGKHSKKHQPTPPTHQQPTPQPTAQPPSASIVASPNPVIVSSDGFAKAYFVLVGNGLTPDHTYSISTNAACSWPIFSSNSALADLDGHIQVSAQFYDCVPGTYDVVAVDSQGGSALSATITLLPPIVTVI
jgi:hypothetical protein